MNRSSFWSSFKHIADGLGRKLHDLFLGNLGERLGLGLVGISGVGFAALSVARAIRLRPSLNLFIAALVLLCVGTLLFLVALVAQVQGKPKGVAPGSGVPVLQPLFQPPPSGKGSASVRALPGGGTEIQWEAIPPVIRASDIINPYLMAASDHQAKINVLTPLLEEGNRRLADLEIMNRAILSDNSFYGGQVQEWTIRCDDTIRSEFGSPNDVLARNHSFETAPASIRPADKELYEQADRRRKWILDKLVDLDKNRCKR
jgi:hypothetical protein